jgi:hypothetical protein
MPTCVWLSAAVEKVCAFLVGMVVLRPISRVKTPPSVSMPSDRGVTSSSRRSLTSPRRTPPWIAAPQATTSSWRSFFLGTRGRADRERERRENERERERERERRENASEREKERIENEREREKRE